MEASGAMAPCRSIAVVSLHFSPAHTSHMLAYGKLLRELGFAVSFVLDERYIEFANFSEAGSVTAAGVYARNPAAGKFDTAIFYNAAMSNSRLAHTMRKRGIAVLYVFHEPIPIMLRLKEGWKQILKLIVAKYCSLAMLRECTGVLAPSRFARRHYDQYFTRYNRNVHTFPLLFDDELEASGAGMAPSGRRYFSFLGNAHKAHAFEAFVEFAKHAIRSGSAIEFAIATKSDLTATLEHDKELARYRDEGRIRIQHGRVMSNQEMNQWYFSSFCVWNVYTCSTQSGVLARAFMAGAPVIALRMGSFPEYVLPGVNGEFVDSSDAFGGMLQAVEKIQADIPAYVAGCRKTFKETFHYRANREALAHILLNTRKGNIPCASL